MCTCKSLSRCKTNEKSPRNLSHSRISAWWLSHKITATFNMHCHYVTSRWESHVRVMTLCKCRLSITKLNLSKAGWCQESRDVLFGHGRILSILMVHWCISNAPPPKNPPSRLPHYRWKKIGCVYKNEVRCKYSTQISERKKKMLFLGHFVVVNWSEQLAVMQVMELLFSFHLQCLCVCVWVCVCQSKRRPGCILDRGTTGGNTARWWPERRKHRVRAHGEVMCTSVSCCCFKHLLPPFSTATGNTEGEIWVKLKYFGCRL